MPQEINAVLNEVKKAVVSFLLNLLAPPNNVNVLQVKKKGIVYLTFNVQAGFAGGSATCHSDRWPSLARA